MNYKLELSGWKISIILSLIILALGVTFVAIKGHYLEIRLEECARIIEQQNQKILELMSQLADITQKYQSAREDSAVKGVEICHLKEELGKTVSISTLCAWVLLTVVIVCAILNNPPIDYFD
jgi:energy-converting hydrogenase Eha subunit A